MLNRLIILTVLAAVHFAQAQKDDAVDLARLVRTAEASKGQCEDPAAFLNNSVNRVLATNSGIRHWRPQSEEQLEKLFVALEKYQSIGAESAAALSLAAHGHFANLNPLQPPLHHLSQCHFQEVTRAIGQMISYFHEAKVSKSKRRNFSEVILTFLKNNCRGPSFIADLQMKIDFSLRTMDLGVFLPEPEAELKLRQLQKTAADLLEKHAKYGEKSINAVNIQSELNSTEPLYKDLQNTISLFRLP